MFEIKSAKKFISQIIVIDFKYVPGTYLLIDFYIYFYINKGRFGNPIQFIIFLIFFVLSGIMAILSGLYIRKSNYFGIKLNLLALKILLTHLFLVLSWIAGFYLIGAILYNSGAYSAMFILCLLYFPGILCFPYLLYLYIYRNKEALKKYLDALNI